MREGDRVQMFYGHFTGPLLPHSRKASVLPRFPTPGKRFRLRLVVLGKLLGEIIVFGEEPLLRGGQFVGRPHGVQAGGQRSEILFFVFLFFLEGGPVRWTNLQSSGRRSEV